MRFWAKTQWGLKCVEKTLKFTYKYLNGKLTFYPFSTHLPGHLSFSTALENNTCSTTISSVSEDGKLPPPGDPGFPHSARSRCMV